MNLLAGREFRSGVVMAAVAGSLVACTALLDASSIEQCSVDADCARRGFAGTRCVQNVCSATGDASVDAPPDTAPVDPKWGCLGKVVWPNEKNTETVVYKQMFVRLIGNTPVTNLVVQACSSLDPSCVSPVSTATTGADGIVTVPVPRNFRGYLNMVTPPASFSNMLPAIFPIVPPPDKDTDRVFDPAVAPALVSTAELDTLLLQIGTAADPMLGHIFGLVVDCTGAPAEGVAITSSTRDGKTISFYYAGTNTPTIGATQTDATGVGGFVNLPAGVIDITLRLVATGQLVGKYPILVRKGGATTIDFWPTPGE